MAPTKTAKPSSLVDTRLAEREVSRYFKQSGRTIILLTIQDILEEELARKLA
jgi:hypothetical protein